MPACCRWARRRERSTTPASSVRPCSRCTGSSRPVATRATCCPDADDPHRRAPDLAVPRAGRDACDALGFDGMLTPCGTGCEDAWLATASLIPLTRRVKFLVAFRPALLVAHARRADGVDLPAPLGRPAPREHRHRRRAGRARALRRPRGQGHALRAAPASSSRSCAARGAVSRSTSTGDHYQVDGATTRACRRNRFPRSTSAARPRRPSGSRPSTSTCTSRGANRPRWWPSASTRMRGLAAAARSHAATSASAST